MKKVLIIRLSSIGDIVLTTPVVRTLKLQIPEMEIHYVVKSPFAGIVQSNPYISKVFVLDHSLKELIHDLKKENYDLIIDLHKNFRSYRIRLALGKPTLSFDKINIRKWFAVRFKMNTLPPVHIVDRYLESTRSLNITNDGLGLDYFIPEKDVVNLNTFPPEFRNGFVGIVVGAKHKTKQLPEEKLVMIIKKLNFPVILLGGKEDYGNAENIRNQCNGAVFNACGKLNLNQSASVVNQANVILTNDTGLMHIAAALKKPVVSVWGNTIPQFGMYPYLPENLKSISRIMEVNGLPCRPCSKIGFDACPKKHFKCMMVQDEEAIVRAVREQLAISN